MTARFLFVTCQLTAEPAVKASLAEVWPDFRFAYSRAGFLTFKLPDEFEITPAFDLKCPFARAWGYVLGRAEGDSWPERALAARQRIGDLAPDAVHLWHRDLHAPRNDMLPQALTPLTQTVAPCLEEALADVAPVKTTATTVPAIASNDEPEPGVVPIGAKIADCILVDENELWVGYHFVNGIEQTWPGGLYPVALPEHAVSRGYLKMTEMLAWSGLPMTTGQKCVEIGCSPGGASQCLLDRGLWVTGVDPADVDATVLAHPRFHHERGRARDLKRRLFTRLHWLVADINMPPSYLLDTLDEIIAFPGATFRGLLLTFKLPQYRLIPMIPEYLGRIRSWGFTNIRARQLHHNGQEICICAK